MQKFIFLFIISLNLSVVAQDVQLSWKKDFNIATELAKAENKPILIYFTKDNCIDCQQFYSNFFKQETFKKLSENFVLLMLDGSNNDLKTTDLDIIKQRRLIMHYNKSSKFPSVLVIDSNGQEIGDSCVSTSENSILEYWSFLETLK